MESEIQTGDGKLPACFSGVMMSCFIFKSLNVLI